MYSYKACAVDNKCRVNGNAIHVVRVPSKQAIYTCIHSYLLYIRAQMVAPGTYQLPPRANVAGVVTRELLYHATRP